MAENRKEFNPVYSKQILQVLAFYLLLFGPKSLCGLGDLCGK